MAARPTFLEFFAGAGMARAGLGAGWTPLFANDLDPMKAAAYALNGAAGHVRLADVWSLTPDDLPGPRGPRLGVLALPGPVAGRGGAAGFRPSGRAPSGASTG